MKKIVAVVICCATFVSPAAAASPVSGLLRAASRASHLGIRRAVPVVAQTRARHESQNVEALDRAYPPAAQRLDDVFATDLGLLSSGASSRASLIAAAREPRATYDVARRVVRTTGRVARALVTRELVRALVDQHFNLGRNTTLRSRNRDAALAANAAVAGFASFATGLHDRVSAGNTRIGEFLAIERSGDDAARRLVAQLSAIGGPAAVQSLLARPPQTTEQVLHLDKFLEREPAAPIVLSSQVGDVALVASETYGELDLRALLGALGIPDAADIAGGWAGGRIALYRRSPSAAATVLVLRWDSDDDAEAWRTAASRVITAAFPDAQPKVCPAVDACWLDGARELAVATVGSTSVLASGSDAELLTAVVARSQPLIEG